MTQKSIVEILDISIPLRKSKILHLFHLDLPKAKESTDTYTFDISGWVLAKVPIVALDIMCEGRLVQKIPVNNPRKDVAKIHHQIPNSENCGFKTKINVIGLPREATLTFRAMLDNGKGEFCGTLTLQHQPLRSEYQPKLQPLLITSTGRSGTTWLMRLLSYHPQIVISQNYPYENRAALYWMQMLKAFSQPTLESTLDVKQSTISEENNWLGRNALYNSNISTPGAVEWVKRKYPQIFASFCQNCIDDFYLTIAEEKGTKKSVYTTDQTSYFAEKNPFVITPLMEIYPDAKEILLVRDFRDMVCSIMAFNSKRKYDDFGRQNFQNDEDYIRAMGRNIVRDLPVWKNRSSRTYVVRYEDLILMPIETLNILLENLKVDSNKSVIETMLKLASEDNPQLKRHRTSSSPKESIGRWKNYLNSHLQNVCQEVFAEALLEFGYTV